MSVAHLAEPPPELTAATVDPDEVAKFAAMAEDWWNPRGKFRPLHKFNPTRLAFIRDAALAQFGPPDARGADARQPLAGLRLLDIGCGGGLLSEPMTRLGAHVVGVDATAANVKTARVHADAQGLDIDYRHGAVEQLAAAGEPAFDIILNMEVVEHVADVDLFLSSCAGLLAPGGLMVLATINRTPKAYALAIFGAERVLRWLPKGTHDYAKLVRPHEARAPLERAGLAVEGPIGVSYNPLTDAWALSNDAAVNYMLTATRAPATAPEPATPAPGRGA